MPKVNKLALRSRKLVLPASATAALRTVATERAGTVILTVPSGLSRTHAAEAVARLAGRPLMSVDLGELVSRYVGETEENLERLFEAAAASGAVLLFDEADALFGKRSDVKDSHDRYANLETGYLLQKIEAYAGIVILASGGRRRIDPAVLRRLRHVVDLPWPPKGS